MLFRCRVVHPREEPSGFRPIRPLPAAGRSVSWAVVRCRFHRRPKRPKHRDRACADLCLLAGQPRHTPIVGLLLLPLIAFLLPFFGAGLKRRLEQGRRDTGHGSVAFGGVLLAAAAFALVGMLEAAMTNAAHEGEQQAVYTLNQLHSYDWLAWNAAFAAVLLARPRCSSQSNVAVGTGLGDDRDRCIAPDPARFLRIHPPSGVVDRSRGVVGRPR